MRIRLNGHARPLRAIAFDLDSTLTRPYLDFRRLRQQLNLPEGDILKWLAELPPAEQVHALQTIEAFEQDGVENVAWNDGAPEILEAVRSMGLPLAIVTRNSRASLAAVCQQLGIAVDLLVAREDAPPKPDPSCLLYTAKQLDVPIEQLLMVGDYRHDVDAGRAAGAITVLLTNGHPPSWSVEADLVIERLVELLSYFDG
ncbi:MAG TPA: HAD family hydrolase [Candidatus Binatia bacterium]|jgi:HAD superfamily hydrolase (TIGR01509 family)|nr:HAD family hydrolase [Candidatus Binatia bacterium]